MTISNFIHWSGLAAIIGGLAGITGELMELLASEIEWIWIIANVLLLIAFTGIFLFQRGVAGLLVNLGYVIILTGLVILIFDFLNPIPYPLSSSIVGIGLIVFSIGTYKAGKLPYWVPVLWIIVPLIGVPGHFWEAISTPIIEMGTIILFVLGLIGAGYRLWVSAT